MRIESPEMLFKALGLNMIQKRGKMDGKLWDITQFGDLEGELNLTRRRKTEMGEKRERELIQEPSVERDSRRR